MAWQPECTLPVPLSFNEPLTLIDGRKHFTHLWLLVVITAFLFRHQSAAKCQIIFLQAVVTPPERSFVDGLTHAERLFPLVMCNGPEMLMVKGFSAAAAKQLCLMLLRLWEPSGGILGN